MNLFSHLIVPAAARRLFSSDFFIHKHYSTVNADHTIMILFPSYPLSKAI
jgi:hypothetical protein